MKYLKYINEGIGGNYLYHFTKNNKILNILRTNNLYLSNELNNGNGLYYITFSRSPDASIGYGRHFESRIVFYKDKLKANFKIKPIDDWYSGKVSDRNPIKNGELKSQYDMNMRNEYEERLLTRKPIINNVIDYIERIDILITNSEEQNNYGNRIHELCKELNIKCFIYENRQDMTLGRNAKEDLPYIDTDYYHEPADDDFDWATFVSLIVYDDEVKDYNLRKTLAENYAIENGIPLKHINRVPSQMEFMERHGYDFLGTLKSNIHNFFRHKGKTGIIREKFHLILNEMRKCKCSSLEELSRYKAHGRLPKNTPKKDWSAIFQFSVYYKDFYNEDSEVVYKPIPNTEKFSNFDFNFVFISAEEKEGIEKIIKEDAPVSNFINLIFNRFTVKKAIKKLEDMSWDEYSKHLLYKIVKINDK